jgi:hypothetical protein
MRETSKPVLIFLHIPKAGGSTVRDVLSRQFQGASILNITNTQLERIDAVPADVLAHTDVLLGHVSFGAHDYLREPHIYFTLLRDPVERVVSQYYHVLRKPSHWLHEQVVDQGLSLEAYVSAQITRAINNGQTRMLSGLAEADPFGLMPADEGIAYGQCPPELLELAARNLREQIAIVGVTERFDESLILLKRRLGLGWPFYVRRNVTPQHSTISDEARRLIALDNLQDQALYHHAKQLLDEAIAREGAGFSRDLRLFRFLNRLYGLIAGLKASARRTMVRLIRGGTLSA